MPRDEQPDAGAMERMTHDPRYIELVSRRSRLAWSLSAVMLAIYFGYVLLIAFRRDLLARPIGEGVTSLGIPLGIGVILAGIALTGIYVHRANRDYDPLLAALRKDYDA